MVSKVIVRCAKRADELQKLVDEAVGELGCEWRITSANTHVAPYHIPGTSLAHGDGPYAVLTTTIVAEKSET